MDTTTNVYTEAVMSAFKAVSSASLDDNYKEIAFRIVLKSILQSDATHNEQRAVTQSHDDSGWRKKIADKLSIETEQVESLYYYDEATKSLRLVIDHRKMPKSLSGATQHIAALLAAGRQAIKLDEGSTDYELIRAAAKEYGVFNSSNFTAYIKALGPRFMISGNGQSQGIQLTLPAYTTTSGFAKQYLGGE